MDDLLIDCSNPEQHSDEELAQALEILNKEVLRRKTDLRKKAEEEVKALMRLHGLTADDFKGGKIAPTSRKPVEPKYRNPANPEETWTGRGRKPAWVIRAEESGTRLEDMLIQA